MSIRFVRPFAGFGALRHLALAGSAAIALTGVSVQAQPGETLETAPVPSTPIAGDFSLAAVGDIIYLRPMLATLEKQAPDMLRILRGADVTFGNFETTALDLATFKGSPQAESGGTWMLADPGVPKDVAAMGIDIVGHANNHATDWGVEGMIETLKLLDAAHLVRAGTGRTMAEARAPAYYDGPQGRVALVSATTTFTPMSPAADPLGRVPGRPGANVIRSTEVEQVSEADLAVLARITGTRPGAPVRIKGRDFRAVEAPTTPMTIGYDLNKRDLAANLLAVRQAKQNGISSSFRCATTNRATPASPRPRLRARPRPSDHRRGRRRLYGARAAPASRHRNLQGQADLLFARQLHDDEQFARRRARGHVRSVRGHAGQRDDPRLLQARAFPIPIFMNR